jgi:hypothetical protein
MVAAAKKVLGRPFRLDPYSWLFEVDEPKSEQLTVVNMALRQMMDDVNAGTVPDFEAVACETGLDIDEVENNITARSRSLLIDIEPRPVQVGNLDSLK